MFKVIYFIVLSIFFTNSTFAKPLPPGTGSTLPANILFMVDGSQSMSNAANGNKTTEMRPPTEVVHIFPSKKITNITKSNPAVVTASSHGYSNGDEVWISHVVGNTDPPNNNLISLETLVNNKKFTIANVTTNTFELQSVDSSAYAEYDSGGAVATASVGNHIVSTIDVGGYYHWDADNSTRISIPTVFAGQSGRIHGRKELAYSVNMEYHAASKRIYTLSDHRGRKSFGKEGGKDCRAGGFTIAAIDTTINDGEHKNDKGKEGQRNNKSFTYFNVDHAGGGGKVKGFLDCRDGWKDYWKENNSGNVGKEAMVMLGPTAISIHNNKLYIITGEIPGLSQDIGGMYVVDLANADEYGFSSEQRVCTNSLPHYKYFNESIDIVTENIGGTNKTFIYSKDTTKHLTTNDAGLPKIWKAEIGSNGCIVDGTSKKIVTTDRCGLGQGNSIVAKDKKIYTTGFYNHQICMYQSNYSSTGATTAATHLKTVGENDALTANSTTDPNLYLHHPMGIDFGAPGTADEDTLFVVSKSRLEIAMLNDDLSYKSHFGDSGVSLLTGAQEAIKNVLSDSATLQQANFGVMFWNTNDGNYNGFARGSDGNFDHSKSYVSSNKLCADHQVCMNVGINPKGAEQIKNYFNEDRLELQFQTKTTGLRKVLSRYFNTSLTIGQIPQSAYNETFKNCQTTALILIGDGEFKDSAGQFRDTKALIKKLYDDKGIITYSVGYGAEIAGKPQTHEHVKQFIEFAEAGGTHDDAAGKVGYYAALRPADLKTVTDQIVQSIISKKVVFSAPNISSEIEEAGELYQAKFQNRTGQEWFGTIIKTKLVNGEASTTNQVWDANEEMKNPNRRNIWTALPAAGQQDINNFRADDATNLNLIKNLFNYGSYPIVDYHRQTQSTSSFPGSTRCSIIEHGSDKGTLDGYVGDEDKGLINFIRGEDYFDYDGDCNLTENRQRPVYKEDGTIDQSAGQIDSYLADIYNSALVVVGPPDASISTQSKLTESYFRARNNYEQFTNTNKNRTEVVYGAANNGLLHAFKSSDGSELWGFIPPPIVSKLPSIIDPSLNIAGQGGTIPRFLLDGSPVVHDTYFNHPTKSTGWYTLLMIPYGRGGAGFSMIDITDVNQPNHIYSILNDHDGQQILRVDHTGTVFKYSYRASRFNQRDFVEAQAADQTLNIITNKVWNISGRVINSADVIVTINGRDKTTSTSFADNGSGGTRVTFANNITYNPTTAGASTDIVSIVEIDALTTGLEYDYRFLGETWASPRVFRMPSGPGDNNVIDDTYAAVLPGGYGNQEAGIGSNVYIIEWTTGKILKEIKIADKDNNIVNSIPATPVVITSDAVQGDFSGALVYVNDLEGKITKINLTNLSGSFALNTASGIVSQGTGQSVALYDNFTFFDLEASSSNNRYMYHSMDAGIGQNGNFWLYGSTGNYMNLSDTGIFDPDNNVKNVMFGIKDFYYPFFGSTSSTGGNTMDTLANCKNMTGDTTSCDAATKRGWYINLDGASKVTAEPTLARGVAYYPIFKPVRNNTECGSGVAYVCGIEAQCGKNLSSELDPPNASSFGNRDCYKVGTGVLSKVVVFNNNLYANISDKSNYATKTDIVIIEAIQRSIIDFRNSWRENF